MPFSGQDGRMPLTFAQSGREICKLLCRQHALQCVDNSGKTPLDYATMSLNFY